MLRALTPELVASSSSRYSANSMTPQHTGQTPEGRRSATSDASTVARTHCLRELIGDASEWNSGVIGWRADPSVDNHESSACLDRLGDRAAGLHRRRARSHD